MKLKAFQVDENEQITWGESDESFRFDSFGELMDYLVSCGPVYVGQVVYYGTKFEAPAEHFVDADGVIDLMMDRADDFAGEYADLWPSVTPEQKAELETILQAWAKTIDQPDFYQVNNVQQYTLTAEDVEGMEGAP